MVGRPFRNACGTAVPGCAVLVLIMAPAFLPDPEQLLSRNDPPGAERRDLVNPARKGGVNAAKIPGPSARHPLSLPRFLRVSLPPW